MRAYLGGTFDPVHIGHVHAAHAVLDVLRALSVTLVLSARPPHRATVAGAEDRWEMLRRAVAQDAALDASDVELTRDGPSFSIDTIEALGDGEPVVWILGSDGLDKFESWYRYDAFPTCCHIVVLARPGARVMDLPGFCTVVDAAELEMRPAGCLFVLETPMLDVSATQIRALVAQNGDPSGLLPPGVWTYIRQRELYRH